MHRSLVLVPLGAAVAAAAPGRDARSPGPPPPPNPPLAAPSMFVRSPCGGARLVAVPARPRQGTLFRVRVHGAPAGVTPRGDGSGEPLHFEAPTAQSAGPSAGVHEALAAAPLDGDSVVRVAVACAAGGRVDTLRATIPLAAADYPLERLRVAPRFSAPPDSALAARLRREGERAAEVGRRAHDTPRLWSAPFRRPRESRVTSVFGSGREFNGAVTSRHLGTDYAGGVGAPVRAANRGVVRLVDAFFLGGNVVYLDHGAGLVTAYLHLSAQAVAVGDTVARGQIIGRVGATGRVTGPHLHWITRYGGVTVDPASVLRVTAAAAAP